MIPTLMYSQSSYVQDEYCNSTLKTQAMYGMNMCSQEDKDLAKVYSRMSNAMVMSYLKEALFVDVFEP